MVERAGRSRWKKMSGPAAGASRTRNCTPFAPTATMWRTSCLLLLMLFTFDFPRDRSVAAEPVRANAELLSRDDDDRSGDRKDTRGRSESREESLAELVGKWRNNGEALEPKWRDGDSVPLLPFSQLSRYSGDKIDTGDEEEDYDRRAAKYPARPRQGSPRHPSGRNEDRVSSNGGSHGTRDGDEIVPRKRKTRIRSGENAAQRRDPSGDRERDERRVDSREDKETKRYQETFQVRANDYEFSDEEYLKPRPRKRRPPQNYEFGLAENETSLSGRRTDNDSVSRAEAGVGNGQVITNRNGQFHRNAMELKSLLKMQQEEGLSLSEILQRRNFTLIDLLKGKTDAINALKMPDTEDYVEEAARTMSNAFTKPSSSGKPRWTGQTKTENLREDVEAFVATFSSTKPGLRKNRTIEAGGSPSFVIVNNGEMYSDADRVTTTGESIAATVRSAPGKATITTSVPIVTNSMELLQADDASVKSRGSDEIKADSLDEDEIMEFSDFTDYKKGRNGVPHVWLMMKEERDEPRRSGGEKSKDHLEDGKGSTLSIEKILRPTERSESSNTLLVTSHTDEEENGKNSTGFMGLDESKGAIVIHSEEGNSTSLEKEYQDDTPKVPYELEHDSETSSHADEKDERKAQEVDPAPDTVLHKLNLTMEDHTVESENSSMENVKIASKDHRDANTTEAESYDAVISQAEPEARSEIFELFASGSAGKRLERLLKSRNMSLEELIALRQRGSSNVHLAEVSRIRAQKSSNGDRVKDPSNLRPTIVSAPKEELAASAGRTITNHEEDRKNGLNNYLPETTENINNHDSVSNSTNVMQTDSTTEQFPSNLESGTKDESMSNDDEERVQKNHQTVETVDHLTTFGSMPFAKDIQRNVGGEYNENRKESPMRNSNLGIIVINNNTKTINENNASNVVQSGIIEEVIREEPSSIDIQTEYREINTIIRANEANIDKGKTLSKVKPSIIASGAILGVTLVVFLAIFVICRIRQKQKYRYRNTFSRAVFQGPVMAARKLSNSSSLSTVMVNVVATSTAKRPDKNEVQEPTREMESRSDIDNDSLDANDSWETIPDYMK